LSTGSTPLVFISHAGADAPLVEALQDELDGIFLGAIDFFNTSDRSSLDLGHHWLSEIEGALRRASVVLAIATPRGLQSAWVNFESGAAWLTDTLVIPCAAGSYSKDALPPPYSQLQAVNLHDAADLAALVDHIAGSLDLRAPTRDYVELAAQLRRLAAESADSGAVDMAALGARRDTSLEIEWLYRVSNGAPDRLAATYWTRMVFEVVEREVSTVEFAFSPATEAVPFSRQSPPVARLVDSDRSSRGEAELLPAHATSGARFAFNVRFDPPLRRGETASLEVAIEFDPYRVRYLDDLLAELRRSRAALRDNDHSSRTLSRPTDHFIYRVLLPRSLDLQPMLPDVSRNNVPFLEEQELVRQESDIFSVDTVERDGVEYWKLELDRRHPPYNCSYKMRWRLPWQPEEILEEPVVS
jgi:TIR domain